ncbi:PAS domain-containing sensor histidine kinase [Sulfitobacter geojensis]|uniref:PAS domain-containing sensor histidine kinase n=1 Tax=Sulfitobacter geojensis TaxID=1342299 RepID=UPI0036D9DF0C
MTSQHPYSEFDLVAAPVFVLEFNEDGAPVYAAFNKYGLKKSGRPLSDYLGKTAQEVYAQAYGRTAYAHHCAARDTGIAMSYQLDLPVGGITRNIRTTLYPDIDETGKVTRLVGCSSDLSVERNAVEAKVQFDTLAAEMEQFVALAAHDLRAPMRQISAIADLLREDITDRTASNLELLDALNKIAAKTMNLVTDVLQHVEIAAVGNTETVFSFPALCFDICDTLDPNKLHNVTTASATLRADRTVLQIALCNMIENTLKHGNRARLNIRIDVREGPAGMIEVVLTDDGNGFSSDALSVMNHSRFRAESGYGLFAVKRLISARGGTLVAQNLPNGTGAIVRFTLPGRYVGGSLKADDQARPGAEQPRTGNSGHRHSA